MDGVNDDDDKTWMMVLMMMMMTIDKGKTWRDKREW